MTEVEQAPPGVDVTTPTPARLYDYYLGGTSNLAIDREVAEQLRVRLPELTDAAWANRGFHQRAVRWMAAEHGIRLFIDIGSGLLTQGNTHEAVMKVAADAGVVHVDHDPMVLAPAKALLAGTRATTVTQADLRDPDAVPGHPELRGAIDERSRRCMTSTSTPRREFTSAPGPGLSASSPARSCSPPFGSAEPGITFVGQWGAEDARAADTDGSRVLCCGVARRHDRSVPLLASLPGPPSELEGR